MYTSSLHGNSDVADPKKIMLLFNHILKKHLFAVVFCTQPFDMMMMTFANPWVVTH